LDEIPVTIAQISMVEDSPGEEPKVVLTGIEGEDFASARQTFEAHFAEVIESSHVDERDLTYSIPREQAPMLFSWHFPNKMPVIRQAELEHRRWERNVEEIWPNLPLAGLEGKTPNEAKGEPEMVIPLKAAIYVLDAFCDRHDHWIDLDAICRRFEVPPPIPIETKPDLPLHSFSAMQLHRLKIPDLSDEQIVHVLNRMLLIHHGRSLRTVLLEALSRPGCADHVDRERVYHTLADLARDRGDRDDTYHWIAEGRKYAQTLDDPFEKVLRWEIRELAFRAEDPGDPNLMPSVNRMIQKYGKKVPQLVEYVITLLGSYGIEPPSNLDEIATQEEGTFSGGGIWTPARQSPETGEKKLWLPGQS